jgi:hypothetical protein
MVSELGFPRDLAPAATVGNSPAAAPVVLTVSRRVLAESRLDLVLLLPSSVRVSPDRTRAVACLHPAATAAVYKELLKSAILLVHPLL